MTDLLSGLGCFAEKRTIGDNFGRLFFYHLDAFLLLNEKQNTDIEFSIE